MSKFISQTVSSPNPLKEVEISKQSVFSSVKIQLVAELKLSNIYKIHIVLGKYFVE